MNLYIAFLRKNQLQCCMSGKISKKMKIIFSALLFVAVILLLFFILWNGLAAGSSHNIPQSTFNAIHMGEIISAIAVPAFGYILWKIKKKDQDNR